RGCGGFWLGEESRFDPTELAGGRLDLVPRFGDLLLLSLKALFTNDRQDLPAIQTNLVHMLLGTSKIGADPGHGLGIDDFGNFSRGVESKLTRRNPTETSL